MYKFSRRLIFYYVMTFKTFYLLKYFGGHCIFACEIHLQALSSVNSRWQTNSIYSQCRLPETKSHYRLLKMCVHMKCSPTSYKHLKTLLYIHETLHSDVRFHSVQQRCSQDELNRFLLAPWLQKHSDLPLGETLLCRMKDLVDEGCYTSFRHTMDCCVDPGVCASMRQYFQGPLETYLNCFICRVALYWHYP